MRRTRPLLAVLGAVLLAAILLGTFLVVRVRARSRSDWLEGKNITLAPVVKGLTEPTFVAIPPDGSGRLFVLERAGAIRVAGPDGQLKPAPFVDLTGQVSTGTEEGMLGLAFHPDFAHNGYVYLDYTANDASVQIVRYTVSPDRPDVVDPATATTVLSIPKKSKYHNGGTLMFGPDGDLYVSVGDDEASEQAQELGTLFGKILRLDVDSAQPYAIPPNNPFVGRDGARGEIWAYGFRNPWRFSFDRGSGDVWIGDVGDAKWEEIDFVPADTPGGGNFGWPLNEGTECMDPSRCHDPQLIAPVVTYGHDMNCAVVGGFVYRGPSVGALVGSYLFGDLCTGGIFSLRGTDRVELGFQPIKISSFGEDPAGEVYVVDLQGGAIYRVADGSLPNS